MTGQRDDAAERSAHVRSASGDKHNEWPVVPAADGTLKLRVLVEKEAEIEALTAERDALRAALVKAGGAVSAAYAQAHAEWRGHDRIASKHDAVVLEWRKMMRAALKRNTS